MFDLEYWPIIFGFLAVFFFTGAGNALNDYLDRDIDRLNHPRRPIPSGKVKPGHVKILAGTLFSLAVVLGALINLYAFLIVLINLAVMLAYEFRTKNVGLLGNLSISWLTASIFLFGAMTTHSGLLDELTPIWLLFILAFFATLGREVIKDIQDVKGDMGRKTLPKRIGIRKSRYVASGALLAAVLISPIPYMIETFSHSYLILILAADITFLYSGYILRKSPGKASACAKTAMLISLLAFIAGGMI
ncbi:MAG: UbiA family prenyltransferase [Thermoplasmata archaeon]|nr:UbiA family prenyltransferase [Thermoplasmata archaeon]